MTFHKPSGHASPLYFVIVQVLDELDIMLKVWKKRTEHVFTAHIQKGDEEKAAEDASGDDSSMRYSYSVSVTTTRTRQNRVALTASPTRRRVYVIKPCNIYSVGHKKVVKGCAIKTTTHATFDHVFFGQQSIMRGSCWDHWKIDLTY